MTATPCPECANRGYIEGPGCNCGVGPSGYYGMHEWHCGLEPCPRGCPFDAGPFSGLPLPPLAADPCDGPGGGSAP